MKKPFNIDVFLIELDEPKKISENDQRTLLGIEEGRTVKNLSILSGKLFLEVLAKTEKRVYWPEDHCLALLVKCMNLEAKDRNRYSHPFEIIVDQEEIDGDAMYDFDQIKKQEGIKAGLLAYGNLGIGQLSVNNYYLLFLQIKRNALPDTTKKDADWFCVGACDLTPEGREMERFGEFKATYGDSFGQGALETASAHNLTVRRLIPMEPLISETELEWRDKNSKESKESKELKRKTKKDEYILFTASSMHESFSAFSRPEENEEEDFEFQRPLSDVEGENLYTSPSQSPQIEVEEEEETEEEEEETEEEEDETEEETEEEEDEEAEGDEDEEDEEDKDEEDDEVKDEDEDEHEDEEEEEEEDDYIERGHPQLRGRRIKRAIRRKELEKKPSEEEENCIASRRRANRRRIRSEIQRENSKITRPVKKRQNNEVSYTTKKEKLNQEDYKNKLRSRKSKK